MVKSKAEKHINVIFDWEHVIGDYNRRKS